MQKLSVSEIIRRIKEGQTFEAILEDQSFSIKINRYLPYCCTAIHAGSNLRKELREKIDLDEYERWYEEDPYTDAFISSMPITIVGHDSRYEYDLNRKPEECLYEIAWGKKVWKAKLNQREKQRSLNKHKNYYKVLGALIEKLETQFGACVVFDMHSYNWQRWDRKVPLFNIGCERIDQNRFGPYIENWREELAAIELNGIENQCAVNDVFYGRGYNLEFITENFNNTLVLATEVAKLYCNELSGEDYPDVIKQLQRGLKQAILNTAQNFAQKESNYKHRKPGSLMDRSEDPALLKVDKALFKLLHQFELLAYVNPVNTSREQKRFINNRFTEVPRFKYNPIRINSFELKQALGGLKTQDIGDVSIRHLYESVINSYFDKIDLLSSLNSEKFLFNSLRYFGRPASQDLKNAHYLLHLPDIPNEPKRMPRIPVEKAMELFAEAMQSYGFKGKIERSNKVISQVMVLNSKKTILFRPDARYTEKEINALIEHEIGVHMVTTQNSALQALKIFNLGLPVNTKTQEGLAILAEYLSGNISLKRLKKLAQRVVVVDMMCNGADFIECFNYLHFEQGLNSSDAFTTVTRIFRGGGFTKDYLYLAGFVQVLKLYEQGVDLNPLLIGKTSLDFYTDISEMIDREILHTPKFVTKSFEKPRTENQDPLYNYIISGLQ